MRENLNLALQLIPIELLNTLIMVFFSTLFSFLIGLPLGIVLLLTDKGGLQQRAWIYQTLGALVNIGRSIPFAILMIALIPFTRFIIGTSLGTIAAIVPLTIAGIPFMARLIEVALKEVNPQMVEAASVMSATTSQIVTKVLIPEALPGLLRAVTVTAVNLIALSAMAGLVGGGGLGKVAIQYGYQRFNGFIMVATLITLLLLVEIVERSGGVIVRKLLKKRGL